MATWDELADGNQAAAKILLREGEYRSSISRAYYAAYCAVTARLVGRIDFAFNDSNPTHEQLGILIVNHLTQYAKSDRYKIRSAVRRLWLARTEADYAPATTIDRTTALDRLRDCEEVLNTLKD